MTTSPSIRLAVASDLESIIDLADARRRQYATYQPVFWRPSSDAAARQRPHFAALIDDDRVITLVAATDQALLGFAIGTVVPAPPVYHPGGPTCIVDDFTVEDPECWSTIGVALLRAVRRTAQRQGAAQIVVVCGHLDAAKRTALQAGGLNIASEWWVQAFETD